MGGKIVILHYPNSESTQALLKSLAEFRCRKVSQYLRSLELNDSARETLMQDIKSDMKRCTYNQKAV